MSLSDLRCLLAKCDKVAGYERRAVKIREEIARQEALNG